MVVAAAIGLGLGMAGGAMLGGQLFRSADAKDLRALDSAADNDENIPEPYTTGAVAPDMRALLPFGPKWTTWPDFEQVRWMNSAVEWLWPHLCKAIHKQVTDIVGPILADVVAQQPVLDSLSIDTLDLGPHPLKLGGVKVYDTKDDEVIMEVPVMWGSAARVHVSARVRAGPVAIHIPVKVEDLQVMSTARVTIRPLVETLPCLGAISISLTEAPYVDLVLKAINDWDLMAMPFLHEAVCTVVRKVTEGICVYPMQIPVPLMPNSGLPKPPCGMLEVYLKGIRDLRGSNDLVGKGDPYVRLSMQHVEQRDEGPVTVWQGPTHETAVKSNTRNPEYNEHFRILVQDLGDGHLLMVEVYDYDVVTPDSMMCRYYLYMEREEQAFLRQPGDWHTLEVALEPPSRSGGGLAKLGRLTSIKPRKKGPGAQSMGTLCMDVMYTPFFRPDIDEEENEKNPAKVMEAMQARSAPRKINADLKGVLTVDLMRCVDLATAHGSSCDSYVEIRLSDPDAAEGADTRRTEVMLNEPSPRFRQKFDFVYVSATSMLTVSVFDKVGAWDVGNLLKLGRKEDALLGKVRLAVKDVVKAGRIKDAFPLQEAEQGDVHMALSWTTVERDE